MAFNYLYAINYTIRSVLNPFKNFTYSYKQLNEINLHLGGN